MAKKQETSLETDHLLGVYQDLFDNPKPVVHSVDKDDHSSETQAVRHFHLIDTTSKERASGEHPIIIETSQVDKARLQVDGGRFADYALQLVRHNSSENKCYKIELQIRSPIIQEALRKILIECVDSNLYEDPIRIEKPFKPLFHNRQLILDYCGDAARTEEETQHLKALTEEFYPLFLKEIEKRWQVLEECHFVVFEMLWTLFPEEEEVLVCQDGFWEVKRVRSCGTRIRNGEERFVISLWSWGYSRGFFGPRLSEVEIPSYAGTRVVDHLECYPLRFNREAESVREGLITRGHKWRELITPSHKHYTGPIWTTQKQHLNTMRLGTKISQMPMKHVHGSIMVDMGYHIQEFPELAIRLQGSRIFADELNSDALVSESSGLGNGLEAQNKPARSGRTHEKTLFPKIGCFPLRNYSMTNEHALLSPAHTQGFSFELRDWGYFLVDKVTDFAYDEKAFDSLELGGSQKNIIHALAHNAIHNKLSLNDHVSGKGKGLVICLEGPPGSGKTLTAESISNVERVPLYCLSTSDLGTNPGVAEQNLQLAFNRAARWKAVLLLDEADVFLATRSSTDMDRNAFVSVFLRLIEYYAGVIFLTTNRIDEFDSAFQSRISFRTTVPFPSKNVRLKIWRHFVTAHGSELETLKLSEDELETLAELELNGREIRNLLSSSLSLAHSQKKDLDMETVVEFHEAAYSWKKRMGTPQEAPSKIEGAGR